MKKFFSTPLKLISVSLIMVFGASGVWAQAPANYPDKPVKVIIPFPAFGTMEASGNGYQFKPVAA